MRAGQPVVRALQRADQLVELDVLRLLGTGATNREIAERLSLTEGTVKNYISAILSKTGVHDRTQAALLAVRRGLIA